jgi:tRNA-splicing ligase RtcB
MIIDGKFLLENGYKEGPKLGQALSLAKKLSLTGLSPQEILLKLNQALPKEQTPLTLRSSPLKVPIAAKAETQEEEENLRASIKKMEELSLCPIVEQVALMPDTCPSGQEYGCIPVGGAISTQNAIIPSAHSADVCCSMRASFFNSALSVNEIMTALESSTHFGPFGRKEEDAKYSKVLDEPVWGNPFLKGLESPAKNYLQTQGDGNHFSYLGVIASPKQLSKSLDTQGYYTEAKSLHQAGDTPLFVLVTHHGSRKLGSEIYKRGLEAAIKETNKIAVHIPKTMAWLDTNSKLGDEYWQALQYSQRWTIANHDIIHNELMRKLGISELLRVGNAHNFVWKRGNKFFHGKGATPAWKDTEGRKQIGIIPLNMASSILITFGEDNREYLSFSPHGAGRNKSRTSTINQFLDKNKKLDRSLISKAISESTQGLDIRWSSKKPDVSESPLGYKDAKTIKAQLTEYNLATIAAEINPKGCIMAGEFEPLWKKLKNSKKININAESINL